MKRRLVWILPVALLLSMLLTGCAKKCEYEGCKEKAVEGGAYCEAHTCHAEGCFLEVEPGQDYCKKHLCGVKECGNPIMEGSRYCAEHTCKIDGCFQQTKEGGSYCAEHSCGKKACTELPIEGGNYCEEHTCHAEGCLQETEGTTLYCKEHKCGKVTCKNLHIENGKYCEEHTCKVDGCVEGTMSNQEYCKEHYAEIKAEIEKKALAKLNKTYDKVEGISWYKSKNEPYYADTRSFVLPYIGVNDSGSKWLRLVFHYTGSDWIFFDKVTIMVDGEKYYKEFDYFDVDRNNGGGNVWEWADISPTSNDIEMLKAIAASSETIVRFQGDTYHYDLTVKSTDKTAIKDVLDAYSV